VFIVDSKKMKNELEKRLARPEWNFSYDKEQESLRVEHKKNGKGMTLSLPGIVNKYEKNKEPVIDDIVYHVEEALTVMNEDQQLGGSEALIYPVIRSTSFPAKTNEGKPLIYEEHTAETRIYYAIDLNNSYRLIDEDMMKKEGWNKEHIQEMSQFNLRALKHPMKTDEVAGNTFYFINQNDGYDASRILNQSLLDDMSKKAKGTLTVAVPHQDVLIFGDIENEHGYDVLGQMALTFFSNGRVPITALPFMYENGKLDPIFIMAKKKRQN
jgi:uncharacterized protein YtpQ (UPF0354 family)